MKFAPERSIYLNGGVNSNSSLEIIMGLSKLYFTDPKQLITLFLSSSGGSVGDAFAMYDYIEALNPKLQTVALGEVSSSAVMIFMAGNVKRYISKRAVMKFHRFSISEVGSINSKDCKKTSKYMDIMESNYVDIMVKKTAGKITRKMANAILDNEAAITAIEAVKLGLAHEIL